MLKLNGGGRFIKVIIVALVIFLLNTVIMAGEPNTDQDDICSGPNASWTGIGILTTKINGAIAKTRDIQLEGFDTLLRCRNIVKRYSHTEDYIGKGGTNGQVPEVQFNFDGDCFCKGSK